MEVPTTPGPAEAFNAHARAGRWPTRIDTALLFQSPDLCAMLALWNSVAPNGRLPSRSAFTARLLKPHLKDLCVLGIEGDAGCSRRYRHRYVGTSVTAVFGELTGLCFDDFLPPELLPRTIACIDAMVAERRPLRTLTRFRHPKADFLAAEVFGAPLSDDGVTPNMAMTITCISRPSESQAAAWRPDAAG